MIRFQSLAQVSKWYFFNAYYHCIDFWEKIKKSWERFLCDDVIFARARSNCQVFLGYTVKYWWFWYSQRTKKLNLGMKKMHSKVELHRSSTKRAMVVFKVPCTERFRKNPVFHSKLGQINIFLKKCKKQKTSS